MRRFEFVEGSSSKFWEVAVEDTALTVRFGRIGAAGQVQTKTFPTTEKAQAELDKLVREKTKKGYVEVGGADAAVASVAAAPTEVAAAPTEAAAARPRTPKPAPQPAPAPDEPGWVDAGNGYQLTLRDGKVVCRNAKGKELASLPKEVKGSEAAEQLADVKQWLEDHDRECLETVETWMLRSLPAPRDVLSAVWPDPSWRAALDNSVVAPVEASGARDLDAAGFFRGVDAQRGIGVVNLDGESVWLSAPSVAIVHPILLPELDEFRGLATELGIAQTLSQLFRETFAKPATIDAEATSLSNYSGGEFEQLNFALGRCRKLGYRVTGGWAVTRVWTDGGVCEARFWVGAEDPFYETETGELIWVDDKQRTMHVAKVPPVAYSEGVRMASLIYAGRKVQEEGSDD